MSNSLFNEFNSIPPANLSSMLSRFNQFCSMFMGNPEVQVRQLLQSGRMTQEQFNRIAQMANQLRPLIK